MIDSPFANRLRKNDRHLRKWARRTGVHAYRIFDHDVPEQPVAIDRYGDLVHVQEYERAQPLPDDAWTAWRDELMRTASEVLETSPERIFLKVRRRLKEFSQYEKLAERRAEIVIEEGGLRFLVNLSDYLDTGLFLDHRETRALVRELAPGKRFLNLFCYTASFSVYAASGGAVETTSADLSNTYLSWAERNFALNGIEGARHALVRSDAREYLERARAERRTFDLIVIDPPTYSKSKMAPRDFDVQRDHVALLDAALARLSPDGVIVFSTNFRKFRLDASGLSSPHVREITDHTRALDFRDARMHRCWLVARAEGALRLPSHRRKIG